VQAARFLESAAAEGDRSAAAEALGCQLAEWAAAADQVPSLAQLPLPAGLEGAVLRWLRTAAAGGAAAPAQLPMFLLQRGHLAEAAAASAAIDGALAAGAVSLVLVAGHAYTRRFNSLFSHRPLLWAHHHPHVMLRHVIDPALPTCPSSGCRPNHRAPTGSTGRRETCARRGGVLLCIFPASFLNVVPETFTFYLHLLLLDYLPRQAA